MKVLVSKAGESQSPASLCFKQNKKMFDVLKLLHAVYPHNVTIICMNNMANTFPTCCFVCWLSHDFCLFLLLGGVSPLPDTREADQLLPFSGHLGHSL